MAPITHNMMLYRMSAILLLIAASGCSSTKTVTPIIELSAHDRVCFDREVIPGQSPTAAEVVRVVAELRADNRSMKDCGKRLIGVIDGMKEYGNDTEKQ